MYLGYKYRIYPTESQQLVLTDWSNQMRFLWNHMLAANNMRYQVEKKFIFEFEMNKALPYLKKAYSWLTAPSGSLQNICKKLDQNIKMLIKDHSRSLNYKKKGKFTNITIQQVNNHIRITDNIILIPKLGNVKIKLHRPVALIKAITISKNQAGQWFVSVLTERTEHDSTQIKKFVGIDLGLTNLIHTSDNQVISNPKYYKKSLNKLKQKQRAFTKCQKGSKNKEKARIKLAKYHIKVANQRKDYLHKITTELVNQYDLITMESPIAKDLLKKKQYSQSISDSGWGMLAEMFRYKCKLKGKHFYQINKYAASTKTCHSCGTKKKLTLANRTYKCRCGYEANRDLNAALNIRDWGYQEYTAGLAEIYACGDNNDSFIDLNQFMDQLSLKQEIVVLGQQ